MKKNLLLTGLFLLASLSFSWAQGTSSNTSDNFSPQESSTSTTQLKALSPSDVYKMQESAVFRHLKKGEFPSTAQLTALRIAYQKAVEQSQTFQGISTQPQTHAADKGMRKIIVGEGGWRMISQITKDAKGLPIRETNYTYDNKGRQVLISCNRYEGTTSYPSWKEESEYDDNDNLTHNVRLAYDRGKQEWYVTYEQKQEYNSSNINTLYERYEYDYTVGELYLSQKSQKVYDENGNILQSVDFGGKTSASGHYTWGSKYEYLYDDYGRQISQISSDLDGNGEFVYSVKYEYGYNQFGTRAREARYDWLNNQWEGLYANGDYYDENGYWCGNYSLNGWNDTYGTWKSGERRVQGTKGNGYWTSKHYVWIPAKQDWVCDSDMDVELNDEGKATLWYSYTYNVEQDGTSTMTYGSKEELTYDGDVTFNNRYNWDAYTKSWVYAGAVVSHQNANGQVEREENYDSNKSLESTTFFTWKYMTWGTEYNDVYLRGEMTNWDALDEYKMIDKHDGTLELYNVTIKKGAQFKFADAEWADINWGGEVQVGGGNTVYYNQRTFLTANGGNLILDMDTDEVLIKKITLNFLTGELYMEYDASTAVNQVAADGKTITVQGNKIVTVGAKNVKVYGMDGTLISQQAVTTVQPGMYVVKADGKIMKVQVK